MTAAPLDYPLVASSPAPLRLVPPLAVVPDATGLAPRAQRFVQAVVEIVEGDRSPAQLLRWTSPRVYTEVARRAHGRSQQQKPMAANGSSRARVVSVKVCRPAVGVAEIAAHVQHGVRSQALAARLELTGERWICTALEWR